MKKIIILTLILTFFLFACDTPNSSSNNDITLIIHDTVSNKLINKEIIINKKYSIDSLLDEIPHGYDFLGFSYGIDTEIFNHSKYTFKENTVLYAHYKMNDDFFKIDKIYNVFITCSSDITSKDNYQRASIKIDDEKYQLNQNISIRLRGNTTFHVPKKSYKIKFDNKVDVLGLGSDTEWALLANYFDPTYTRNFYAYRLSEALGLDYSIQTKYVNLFLNNQYVGIYLLTETVKTSQNRINIEKNNSKIDEVPFLLELDMKVVQDNPNYEDVLDIEAFILDNSKYNGKKYPFATKYPKSFKDINSNQYNYIKEYMRSVYLSVRNGNFEEYIDLESFINYFIIQELFMNVDLDYSSVYLYKPFGEKLHFGPVWDFDLSSGNVSYLDNYHPNTTMTITNGGNYLFTEALKNKNFNKLVNDRIEEIENIINNMLDSIEYNYYFLERYYVHDNSIWNILNDHNWARPLHLVGITHYEQVMYLKQYISTHYKYIKTNNI